MSIDPVVKRCSLLIQKIFLHCIRTPVLHNYLITFVKMDCSVCDAIFSVSSESFFSKEFGEIEKIRVYYDTDRTSPTPGTHRIRTIEWLAKSNRNLLNPDVETNPAHYRKKESPMFVCKKYQSFL